MRWVLKKAAPAQSAGEDGAQKSASEKHLRGGAGRTCGSEESAKTDAPDGGLGIRARSGRSPNFTVVDAIKSLAILVLCTLVDFWFYSMGFSAANIITVYILGVLFTSIVTSGRTYSAASSVLSVLAFNYFFTEPRFTLAAHDPGYPVTFLIMLTAAFITGTLAGRVKEQARQSAQKAYRTEVLLETNRKLQQAKDNVGILGETARQLVKLLEKSVVAYPVKDGALSEPSVFSWQEIPINSSELLGVGERAVAEWVFKNNRRAGATTSTLPGAKCLYLAVRGADEVLAVFGIVMGGDSPLDAFEKSLVIAMLGECALALEKERLSETQKRISLEIEREKLRANLLRMISHDLRTPLTSISGNAGILMGSAGSLSDGQKRSLYADIYDDSMWLINLVENLLSITRLDNGAVSIALQPELVEEVVEEALQHVDRRKAEHRIEVRLGDELMMARMDSRLIAQVLINLVNNAIRYTLPGSRIEISAHREERVVVMEVSDDGPGIPKHQKEHLFDMFYTADNALADGRRGLGLGLSLCRSIVQAHGGAMALKDNSPRGTVFSFTLPLEEVTCHE
jgi:two-component system sensor histidine kinase KdpD